MALRYGDALRAGEILSCQLGESQGLARLTLSLSDPHKDRRLELHVDFVVDDQAKSPADEQLILDALDFLDGVVEEIFASQREAWPPLDPSPYQFEGRQFWLSGGLRRPQAEARAEALLATSGSAEQDEIADSALSLEGFDHAALGSGFYQPSLSSTSVQGAKTSVSLDSDNDVDKV